MDQNLKAIVLAAGKGTRLQTEGVTLPKVMRQAAGRPLLHYVLESLRFLDQKDVVLVVGYGKEDVLSAYPGYPYAEQREQKGTGHAVASAEALLKGFDGDVLVCCGDMPLMRRESYEALVARHRAAGNACTLLSGVSEEPLPYGRVIRDDAGGFVRIVEDRDATLEEQAVRELNAGVYVFRCRPLLAALKKLRCDNAQGEYYLTDVPALLRSDGEKVDACPACTPLEMLGVNTPEQLRQVEETLRNMEG